jgi:rRNA maturation endonuclease Nob1
MSAKNQINKIKTLLGLEIKLEQMKLENGTILEAEAFEAGAEIFIVNEEDRIAVPMGEYMLEDGKVLIITEDGIIGEIKDAEEEAPAEEAAPEAEVEVEAEAETSTPKKVVESITKEMFFSEIEKLRNEIAELKAAKVEVKEEVELSAEVKEEVAVELSAEEAEPLKHNPEGAVEKKQTNLFAQKAPKTTRDLVFSKLFNQ